MSDGFDGGIGAADVADFLEKGLLENLVALFRAQPSLYPLIGELLQEDAIATRVGASALAETLAEEDPGNILLAVRALLPLLGSEKAVVRGDAAYLLGALGRAEALGELRRHLNDEDRDVRAAVREAVALIEAASR